MENVADSSVSRVKMVNSSIECDTSTYAEAKNIRWLVDGHVDSFLTKFNIRFCYSYYIPDVLYDPYYSHL